MTTSQESPLLARSILNLFKSLKAKEFHELINILP